MRKSEPFQRVDESADSLFYATPRFVEHIDEYAIAAVEELYRERLQPDSDVLDLMSSWVSHLPPELALRSVVGLGMNARELAANKRLTRSLVHDLNADPHLPFDDASFDTTLICVSIQYLTQPVAVLREVARVLRPGGELIVTFSNRCFPTKAVAAWQMTRSRGHVELIARYLRDAGGWEKLEALDRSGRGDPLYAVVATRKTNAA